MSLEQRFYTSERILRGLLEARMAPDKDPRLLLRDAHHALLAVESHKGNPLYWRFPRGEWDRLYAYLVARFIQFEAFPLYRPPHPPGRLQKLEGVPVALARDGCIELTYATGGLAAKPTDRVGTVIEDGSIEVKSVEELAKSYRRRDRAFAQGGGPDDE